MKYITLALLLVVFVSCTKKVITDHSVENKVSIPFKLGEVKFDDRRGEVVQPNINLSAMPSEGNVKDISPKLSDELVMDAESIVQRAFRGNQLTYDVVIVINKANKYMAKTWKESRERAEVELILEIISRDDVSSMYQTKSVFSSEFDGPNVTDQHAQELFDKTFRSALYLGLKKLQNDIRN